MKHKLLYSLLLMLMLQACGNNGQQNASNTTNVADTVVDEPTVAPITERWYKHYTGTVGGAAVLIDLCSFADVCPPDGEGYFAAAAGTCTYMSRNRATRLIITAIKGDSIFITENDNGDRAAWALVRRGSTLVGKWAVNGIPTAYDITLKEDYSGGSYALNVVERSDSCTVDWGNEDSSRFDVSLMVLAPGNMNSADAEFLEYTLVHALYGDTLGARTLQEYVTLLTKQYVKTYKQHIAQEQADSNEYSTIFNNEIKLRTECMYNNNGFVEFQFNAYGFMGGMHGVMEVTTTCIDMKARKRITLADVILRGAELGELLEKELTSSLELTPKEDIKDVLLHDEVTPSQHFIITDQGIAFCYSQGEIVGSMYGDITLLLPYASIKEALKPEFRERMGVK